MKFELVPFQSTAPFPLITGQLQRRSNALQIRFDIREHDTFHWQQHFSSEAAPIGERRSGLWANTCFECFIGLANTPQYFECNFSPTGDWQVFHFDDYRQPEQRESDDLSLRRIHSDELGIECLLEVNAPPFVTKDWHISPSCILAHDGRLHYYAANHPSGQPDFHLPALREYILR